MEDVYINDRRQFSAKAVTREQELKQGRKRRRSFRQYLADLIIKSLIAAALLCIDFSLFAEAGSYSLFSENRVFNPEALYIIVGIVASTFILMYLLSFSKFLQNLLTTAAFGFFLFAVFNQFALFDKGSFLYGTFGQFFNDDIAASLLSSSHFILIGFLTFLFLLFMLLTRRSTQGYFMGILIFTLGGIISEAYFNPVVHNFRTVYEPVPGLTPQTENATGKNKNFIFLTFPGLTSYHNLHDFMSASSSPLKNQYNEKIQSAIDNMLGFYTQNNFTLYSGAYIVDSDPFLNLTAALNPGNVSKDPQDYTLSNVLLNSYWDFNDIVTPTLYLKENKLFETFQKNKYQINVYQTRGLETCYVNNRLAVNKCVAKENLPIDFEQFGYSEIEKTALLFTQWIESSGLISNFNPLYQGLNFISDSLKPVNFSTNEFYVVNSFKTFDLLSRDIAAASGRNAFFATIDLPSDLYIYDSFCRIKPFSKWESAQNETWFNNNNVMNKREAYAEQMSCLYGQLEHFIQNLSNAGQLDNSVIVIQGLNNPSRFTVTSPGDAFGQFKGTRQITMAIFDPLKNKAQINNEMCSAPALLKSYLYKKYHCTPFEGLKMDSSTKEEISKKASEEEISPKTIATSLPNFLNWYQQWADANKVENNLSNLVIPTENIATHQTENAVVKEIKPEAETEIKPVAEVPEAMATEELPPEEKNASLSAAMNAAPVTDEETETEAVQTEEETIKVPAELSNAKTPEEKKAAFRALAEKTVDNTTGKKNATLPEALPEELKTEGTDVIPPFLDEDDAS